MRKLAPIVAAKLDELKTTIELRRANKSREAVAIVETDRGKAYMDELRAACAEIEQRAAERLAISEADAKASSLNLRRVSTGGALALGGFLMVATLTIFRGMTRRDALFRQAYEGEKLMATTLASIADGVIATDAEARVTFINPVAQWLTGWDETGAIGVPIKQVFPIVNETTRLPVANPIEKALAQGVAVGLANHTNLISKTGEECPIDDSAAPVKNVAGRVVGAVLVFRDISERRRAERQLRHANEELQQFVDAAAHDLYSPLNSVNGMAQMLADRFQDELGPTGQEIVGYITAGMARMRRLLDDLLAFARASHFDETTAPQISLDAALHTALENLKVELERTGATVLRDPLPAAVIHPAHALQLFQNLIGNAVKYHGPESPRIAVRAERGDGLWVIRVADNGIGIEPEFVEQIFKPFKRLHGDDYPGSGIGLATCERIIKGYGGHIWAESSPGQGSTFCFALPVVEEKGAAKRTTAS